MTDSDATDSNWKWVFGGAGRWVSLHLNLCGCHENTSAATPLLSKKKKHPFWTLQSRYPDNV